MLKPIKQLAAEKKLSRFTLAHDAHAGRLGDSLIALEMGRNGKTYLINDQHPDFLKYLRKSKKLMTIQDVLAFLNGIDCDEENKREMEESARQLGYRILMDEDGMVVAVPFSDRRSANDILDDHESQIIRSERKGHGGLL